MSYRLAELDCAQARMQNSVGVSAIQVVWLYDRPVNLSRLEAFHESLKRGRLGRVIAPAVIAPASDRWSGQAAFAPLEVRPAAIPRAELEEWIAEHDIADLAAYGGPAWRLAVTALDDGGSAVSLLVSHAIADARSLGQAIIDAVAGETLDVAYPSDTYGKGRLLVAEAAASLRQLGRVAKLHLAQRSAAPPVAEPTGQPTEPKLAEPKLSTPDELGPLDADFRIPRVTALIPTTDWYAAADARGGTGTTLAVGVMADLAAALGRTTTDGIAHIAMPISTRTGDSDLRANAVRGIRLEVDTTTGLANDLASLRKKMKSQLQHAAATSDPNEVAIATNMTIPRFWLARTVWRSVAPDHTTTGCSVVGKLDDQVVRIDGANAVSMSMGFISRGIEDPARLAKYGGGLWLLMVETAGSVALRISGFHPATPLTRVELKAEIGGVLDGYGLTATLW